MSKEKKTVEIVFGNGETLVKRTVEAKNLKRFVAKGWRKAGTKEVSENKEVEALKAEIAALKKGKESKKAKPKKEEAKSSKKAKPTV